MMSKIGHESVSENPLPKNRVFLISFCVIFQCPFGSLFGHPPILTKPHQKTIYTLYFIPLY